MLFLDRDQEAAEEILGYIAEAVRGAKEAVDVTSPLALSYRKYFDYADPDWAEAHDRMYAYIVAC